jgi:hypothetical protein
MICYQMKKKVETEQLNVRPLKSTIERLGELAERYKGDKGRKNEVAVEILEQYADLWEAAELFTKGVRMRQAEELRKRGEITRTTFPAGKANVRPEKKVSTKTEQGRKK